MKIIIVLGLIVDGVVAELVDAPDSKSGSLGSGSSILPGPTIEEKKEYRKVLFFCVLKCFKNKYIQRVATDSYNTFSPFLLIY